METTTIKEDKIGLVLKNNGAFCAFGTKQFDEQKKEGVKYISMGAGLICPKENADKLNKELNHICKEIKKEEKAKMDARAKALKIEMLPKMDRLHNRKILLTEALNRVNNFMDCDYLGEHYKMIKNSTEENIIEVIDFLLSAISYRYHNRADYEPEVKECYDDNINIIKELKDEVINILNEA